jgi:hypothetical protein
MGDYFRIDSVLLKKNVTKLIFFKKTETGSGFFFRTKTGSNQFGSVFLV